MTTERDGTMTPCISCGCEPRADQLTAEGNYFVECKGCGRRTYYRPKLVQAIADWNKGLVAVSRAKWER